MLLKSTYFLTCNMRQASMSIAIDFICPAAQGFFLASRHHAHPLHPRSSSEFAGCHVPGCQVKVTLNRMCVRFKRRQALGFRGCASLMKWLCVIYSPLLKGWMSVCSSVCVCVLCVYAQVNVLMRKTFCLCGHFVCM